MNIITQSHYEHENIPINTAHRIWSVISWISNLNRSSRSLLPGSVENRLMNTHEYTWIPPISFGVSFFQSRISINHLVLWVSFATFRWKETNEIEFGDWDLNDTPNAMGCDITRSNHSHPKTKKQKKNTHAYHRTELSRPRRFLDAGFRPRIHSLVWVETLTPN